MFVQITILCFALAIVLYLVIEHMIPDIAKMSRECLNELEAAKEEVRLAEQDFDYAEPEYVDAAIYKLKAVEERRNALIREKRGA